VKRGGGCAASSKRGDKAGRKKGRKRKRRAGEGTQRKKDKHPQGIFVMSEEGVREGQLAKG